MLCSTPCWPVSSGRTTPSAPSTSSSAMPSWGAGPAMMRLSSPNTRSAATSASRGALARADARAAASTSRLNSIERRARRMIRRASSSMAVADTRRSRRASRSARPPNGSRSSPPSRGSAMALTVKSRRARSCSMDSPSSGIRSTCQVPARSVTRQAPKASESGNAAPPFALARRRASGSTSPWATRSTSSVERPRNRSRTAPPTTQTGSPASAARAAASARFTPAPRRGGRRAGHAE